MAGERSRDEKGQCNKRGEKENEMKNKNLKHFFHQKKKETKNWKAYTVTVWSVVKREYRTM